MTLAVTFGSEFLRVLSRLQLDPQDRCSFKIFRFFPDLPLSGCTFLSCGDLYNVSRLALVRSSNFIPSRFPSLRRRPWAHLTPPPFGCSPSCRCEGRYVDVSLLDPCSFPRRVGQPAFPLRPSSEFFPGRFLMLGFSPPHDHVFFFSGPWPVRSLPS